MNLRVRLRERHDIGGSCPVKSGATLKASTDLGVFADAARNFVQAEERAAREEAELRLEREAQIDDVLNENVAQANFRGWKRRFYVSAGLALLLLILLIACTVWAFHIEHTLQAQVLAPAAAVLVFCAGGVVGCGSVEPKEVHDVLKTRRPELQNFYFYFTQEEYRWLTLRKRPLHVFVPFIGFTCTVAMTVAYDIQGFTDGIYVLWFLPFMMCLCFCFGLCDRKRIKGYLCCFFWWPWHAATIFGEASRHRLMTFVASLYLPRSRSLDRAILETRQHTIVFEGRVIPGQNTVASWPGKYESAWDDLVQSARQDAISAAVVFLPEGSEHFGAHDQIPATHAQSLPSHLTGGCWCTPLYGESKPWGCRWWTKWIANIEFAVQNGACLEVYYFNRMVGKGKVQNFTTAGEEHLRRERTFERKLEFKKSESFLNALEKGLANLSQQKGPDSSSAYSREERRLFLAWLPEEDRKFLEESEGLGNSQKSEVAWLERKGYHYIEKEVDSLADSSPEAMIIGRDTESEIGSST